jgi:hypothetical protein
MYTFHPFANRLWLDREWISSLKTGEDKNVFKKFLKERTEEFFITSDEDRERHLKGKIHIDEHPIYPNYEDNIIEGLTPSTRLEYILIVLNGGGGETQNNLDILYALLHNYHLICKELSPRIINALEIGVADVRKFSCFLETSQKWNDTLNELSLAFDTNLDSFIVEKDDWKEYSQWDDFIPMPNPQESIEEYLKLHLTKKPKEMEVDNSNYPKQGGLFENKIKEIKPPESTTFNLVIDYIKSFEGKKYSSELLEMVEAIKFNNTMIWVYKDNRDYIVISNTFPSVTHYYKNIYSTLSPKELAIQVYTFGVEYKPRFPYWYGNGNWDVCFKSSVED